MPCARTASSSWFRTRREYRRGGGTAPAGCAVRAGHRLPGVRNRVAMLAGMPLAGGLIAVVGPASVVLIDGISFAAGVVILGMTVPASLGAVDRSTGSMTLHGYLSDLREGLRFLGADRLLLGIV